MKINGFGNVPVVGLAAALLLLLWTWPHEIAGSDCTDPNCHGGAGGCPACQHCCAECGTHCDPCDLQVCTVMVPARVVETRVKVDVVKEPENREEKYTVFQLVPKTRKYDKEKCYLKHEVKSKVITKEQCHLVKLPVERTVNVTTYHPECREIGDPCGECPPQVCEVMVPTTQQQTGVCEEIQVAMAKTECEIFYCVKTPEKLKIPCTEEKYFELVPVTKSRTVSVCVPKVVRSPYEVIVCKEIPQQILCCAKCAKKHCK